MLKFLKKDSYLLGFGLATVTPVVVFFVLTWLVNVLSAKFTQGIPLIRFHNIILVSIFLNMLIFGSYINKSQYDKSGRGIMVVTFVMTGIYFIWRYKDLAF